MKVLWITNILFPDICKDLGRISPVTGGWMKSLADALIKYHPDIELTVAALYGDNKELYSKKNGNITYYCLPFNAFATQYNLTMEPVWQTICKECQPDVVHIHGTEFSHGLAYMRANGCNNVVISIQGLVAAYARYSLGQIPVATLKKHRTIYDYFRRPILQVPNSMEKQGLLEIEYLQTASHIIGRTDWDYDHAWAINPNIKYHFCNETLRKPFYNTIWNLERCEKHSIFLSQAHKPIKGIHKVIEALPYILRHYPDTKVYVAGNDFTQRKTWKEKLKFSTYANYVCTLMDKYKVRDKFIFTGLLDEDQMAQQYAQSHVFICPSSIENSPNSLGEAQLVGTPVVASYVGGVMNMVEHEKTGLMYRFEEHEMLAQQVCRIFGDDEFANKLSQCGKTEAQKRHDPKTNADRNYEIYTEILKTGR